MGDQGINFRGKNLLYLNYAHDLSILDESASKMNKLLDVLRVQSSRIGLKINVKKTKSLRLGIIEDEKVTLANEKIDQMGSFTYLGSIISKEGGSREHVKSRIAKALGIFSQLKQEPRAHMALVTRSEPKIRLGTRVFDFAVLCLFVVITKINLQIQCSCSLFLFGIVTLVPLSFIPISPLQAFSKISGFHPQLPPMSREPVGI